MSTSRNHRLVALTDEQRTNHRRLGQHCTRGCQQDAVASAEFEFVTGRSGRIGTRSSLVCADHANAFAAKHGIANPAVHPPEHADPQGAGT